MPEQPEHGASRPEDILRRAQELLDRLESECETASGSGEVGPVGRLASEIAAVAAAAAAGGMLPELDASLRAVERACREADEPEVFYPSTVEEIRDAASGARSVIRSMSLSELSASMANGGSVVDDAGRPVVRFRRTDQPADQPADRPADEPAAPEPAAQADGDRDAERIDAAEDAAEADEPSEYVGVADALAAGTDEAPDTPEPDRDEAPASASAGDPGAAGVDSPVVTAARQTQEDVEPADSDDEDESPLGAACCLALDELVDAVASPEAPPTPAASDEPADEPGSHPEEDAEQDAAALDADLPDPEAPAADAILEEELAPPPDAADEPASHTDEDAEQDTAPDAEPPEPEAPAAVDNEPSNAADATAEVFDADGAAPELDGFAPKLAVVADEPTDEAAGESPASAMMAATNADAEAGSELDAKAEPVGAGEVGEPTPEDSPGYADLMAGASVGSYPADITTHPASPEIDPLALLASVKLALSGADTTQALDAEALAKIRESTRKPPPPSNFDALQNALLDAAREAVAEANRDAGPAADDRPDTEAAEGAADELPSFDDILAELTIDGAEDLEPADDAAEPVAESEEDDLAWVARELAEAAKAEDDDLIGTLGLSRIAIGLESLELGELAAAVDRAASLLAAGPAPEARDAVAWLGNRIAAIAADRGDAAVIASEPDFRQIERRLGLAPAAGPTAEPAPVDPSPDEGAPAGEAALIASPDAALSEAPEGDGAGGLLDRRALDDLLDVARQLVLNKNQIRSLGETLRRDLPDRDEAELLSAKTDEYARLVERLQGRLDATRVETIGQIVGRLGVGRFGSIELIGGAVGVDRGHSLPLGEVLASLVEAAGSMFGGEGEQPDVRVFAIDKRYHVVLAVSTPFDGDGVPPAPAEAEEAAARIGASISTAVEGRRLVFTVTLPVQGAVIEVVRVAVGGETFALPVGLIKEVIETAEHHMQTIQGSAMIRVRNTIMPLIDAHGVLDTRAGAVPRTAIVVMTDAGSAAIRIDEVLGRQEIVIDRMGLAEDEHGPFLGATIEDDGSIALVVDVDRLVTDHVRFGSRRVFPLTRPPAGDAADAEPEIIVEPRPADGSEVA